MPDELYKTGDIMVSAKVGHATVLRYSKSLGIQPRLSDGGHRRWTKDEALQIVAAILKGKPRYKEIVD